MNSQEKCVDLLGNNQDKINRTDLLENVWMNSLQIH